MASTLADDPRDLALGLGAGVVSFLAGLALLAVAVFGRADVLAHPAVAGGVGGVALAFGVAGLYEITTRGMTRSGVADLTIGAALVLVILGPYGENSRAFVVVGAMTLLAGGVYHAARAARVAPGTDEPATDVDGEGAT